MDIGWLLGGVAIGAGTAAVLGALALRRQKRSLLQLNAEIERFRSEQRQLNASQTVLLAEKSDFDELKFKLAESNINMLELKEELEVEKERSEKLLRNILPERVISELREKGFSEPESFESVTVFFSDIVGFTEKSAKLDPKTLIRELSDLFTHFDRIFVANGCERIKTIGDAYLSVSGLPAPDERHCCNILNAAIEAMRYLEERNRSGALSWEMRMGVHTGRVVGGIVGTEKYIYDVFGDTINTASRMESNSEPMCINVSHDCRMLAGKEFRFVPRPPRTVKGKGVLQMYFLEWRP